MTEFKGIFSDGKSAAAYDVRVQLTDAGIQFSSLSATDTQSELYEEWTYDQLTSSQPVHPPAPTQLGTKEHPGATLFVSEAEFGKLIAIRAPHLSKRAERWRIVYPTLAVSFLICCAIAFIYISDIDVFQKVARYIPEDTRDQFGKQVISGQIGDKKQCSSSEGIKSLQKIQARLENSHSIKKPFNIRVAKIGIVNAFAAPGRNMLITGELIETAKTPEEIAGVMAHEMGHGMMLHAEAGFLRAVGLSITISLITGGDASWLGDLGFNLLELRNRRSAERDADKFALRMLKQAGISAKPMLDFYERILEEHEKKQKNPKTPKEIKDTFSSISDLLSTHPSTPERMKLVQSQPDWPTTPLLTDQEWQALKSICK